MRSVIFNRGFADDGLRAVPPGLVALLPSLSALCFAPVGLKWKPEAWEVWAPAQLSPDCRRACERASLRIVSPEGGLIIVGGGLDAAAVLGPDSACARIVDAAVCSIHAGVSALRSVLLSCPPALVPEVSVFQTAVRAIVPKASHVCRVCPPSAVEGRLDGALASVERLVADVAGWCPAERDSALPQMRLGPRQGGLGVPTASHLARPAFVGSCLSVAQVLNWGEGGPGAFWASCPSTLGRQVQDAYKAMRDFAPSLFPPSLAGLEVAAVPIGLRMQGAVPKWQALFSGWLGKVACEAWLSSVACKHERARARTRLVAADGAWLFVPVPVWFPLCLDDWRTALRLRMGLPVSPAFTTAPETRCALITADGTRCDAPLDVHGNHALTCCKGRSRGVRHDRICVGLDGALKRRLLPTVREVWCSELYDREKDKQARMDLVVHQDAHVSYVDVTVVHAFSGKGEPRAGGGVAQAEAAKRRRYPMVVDGIRVSPATFVPLALGSLGQVGPAARAFFRRVESTARGGAWDDGGGGAPEALGPLCSFLAAMFSAGTVKRAHTSPDEGPLRSRQPRGS